MHSRQRGFLLHTWAVFFAVQLELDDQLVVPFNASAKKHLFEVLCRNITPILGT